MNINIAIDGPAGAGKSTIAKQLAADLSYVYVDTGAMYRAMALYFMEQNIDAANEQAISRECGNIEISISYEAGEQQVFLNGSNVNDKIRSEKVGNMTSFISAYPAVRSKLVELQRELAKKKNVIMDGRDIGTCVLPDAQVKIYLTASVETRAKRRYEELTEKGLSCNQSDIERDIEKRDYQDMHREISPLRQADDAILVDSSNLTITEVVSVIKNICKEKGLI